MSEVISPDFKKLAKIIVEGGPWGNLDMEQRLEKELENIFKKGQSGMRSQIMEKYGWLIEGCERREDVIEELSNDTYEWHND